jgi:hypothetical protein
MGQSIFDAIISRQPFASYPAGGFLVYADLDLEYDDAAVVQKLKDSVELGVDDSRFSDALVQRHSTDSLGLLQLIINALTHDPDNESRQAMYTLMDKLFCLFEPQSRYAGEPCLFLVSVSDVLMLFMHVGGWVQPAVVEAADRRLPVPQRRRPPDRPSAAGDSKALELDGTAARRSVHGGLHGEEDREHTSGTQRLNVRRHRQ